MENQNNMQQNNQESKKQKECKMSVYRYIGVMLILIVILLAISHMVQYRNNKRLEQELAGAQKNISDVSDREKGVSARYAQLQTEYELVQSRLVEAEENLALLEEEKQAEVNQLQEEAERLREERDKLLQTYELLFAMDKAWRDGDREKAAHILAELEKVYGVDMLQEEALSLYELIRADLQKNAP
jgi:biopolymer transport protein ExbD